MKQFADLVPVALFFGVYLGTHDMFAATAALMAATAVQVALVWLVRKRVGKTLLYTAAVIEVLGATTLILHDPTFIKWKPTVVNWALALIFIVNQLGDGEPLVRRMALAALEKSGNLRIEMPDRLWRRLNLAWIGFFLAVGVINLYVAFTFDEALWVKFKLFGLMGLNMAFIVAQFAVLSRYTQTDSASAPSGS